MDKRLYVITRQDLTIGQKTAQTGHAIAQYILDHSPHESGEWNNDYLICLEDHKLSMEGWIEYLIENNIKHSIFKEPDMDHEITSISALHSGEIFKGLSLIR